MLNSIFLLALILLVWFETDAFVEYLTLFGIRRFLIDEYLIVKAQDPNIEYLTFLTEYHNNFFTRLITCPICTSVWLGCFISCLSVSSFPVITILGLSIYLLIKKLLNV